MPVNKYEAFLKAAELGSLTRAAAELGVTQSAVSHMIGALEEELGFSLLKRGRGGARATAEGERVLPAIRGMLNSREQLEQTAAAIRGLDCGTVRIGTFTSVAVHWLPGMIKRFQSEYPDVEQWLSEGSVDLGFIALPTRLKGRITALLEDRLLAVVPVDHRLASLPRFPIKEVENEPFISLLETSDHDARRALEAAGVKPNIRYTTKDDYAIIAMVEQGLGVSIMPELLLSGRSDNVRIMELTPPASRTIGLCLPDADRAGPATLRFADCVSDWVREHYSRLQNTLS